MEPVDRISIGAKGSVSFAPGSLHVMLHGREFKAGERFQFYLVLEDGDRVPVLADVVTSAPGAHHDQRAQRDHRNHHSGGVE
jgi:copper(I)-binding protein